MFISPLIVNHQQYRTLVAIIVPARYFALITEISMKLLGGQNFILLELFEHTCKLVITDQNHWEKFVSTELTWKVFEFSDDLIVCLILNFCYLLLRSISCLLDCLLLQIFCVISAEANFVAEYHTVCFFRVGQMLIIFMFVLRKQLVFKCFSKNVTRVDIQLVIDNECDQKVDECNANAPLINLNKWLALRADQASLVHPENRTFEFHFLLILMV